MNIALLLLDVALGDLHLLGEKKLVDGNPSELLSELDLSDLHDIVVAKFDSASSPFLEPAIRQVLSDACFSIPKLLEHAISNFDSDPDADRLGSQFPIEAFSSRQAMRTSFTSALEISDSHLHSGGSMPLGLFLQALSSRSSQYSKGTRRTRSRESDMRTLWVEGHNLYLVDSRGFKWNIAIILAGIRVALRVLSWGTSVHVDDGLDSCEKLGLPREIVDSIRDSSYWTRVRRCSLEFESSFVAGLDCYLPLENCPEFPSVLSRAFSTDFFGDIDEQCRSEFLVGLLRSVVAVSQILSSRPGEGLTRFVRRFSLLSDAWTHIDQPGVEDFPGKIIASTIDLIALDRNVVGVEMRKSVRSMAAPDFAREILRSLDSHLFAFERVADRSSLAMSMPVGFLRSHSDDRDPLAVGQKELGHVCAGVSGLDSVSSVLSPGDFQALIHSIDVASDELGSNNWPFVVGFELLRKRGLELLLTIHCGESFTSLLNGVRRLGELFLGEFAPHRVGHALALSERTARRIVRASSLIVRAEAIFDLCWLRLIGLDVDGSAFRLLARLLAPTSETDAVVNPDTAVAAFKAIHRLDGLEGLVLDTTNIDFLTSSSLRQSLLDAGELFDKTILVFAGVSESSILGWNSSDRICGEDLEEYLRISELSYRPCLNYVMELFERAETVVESCVSSNNILSGASSVDDHPIFDWAVNRPDLRITVSSDDPIIFRSTISNEFRNLAAAGLPKNLLERLAKESVACCSGGPETRRRPSSFFAAARLMLPKG